MDDGMVKTIEYALKHKVPVITTVEAFHKEPFVLYDFLRLAANSDVEVIMAPIKTTDQRPNFPSPKPEGKPNE